MAKVVVLFGDMVFGFLTSAFAMAENRSNDAIQAMSTVTFFVVLCCTLIVFVCCTILHLCWKGCGLGTFNLGHIGIYLVSICYFIADNIPQIIYSNSQGTAAVPAIFYCMVSILKASIRTLYNCFKCCKDESCRCIKKCNENKCCTKCFSKKDSYKKKISNCYKKCKDESCCCIKKCIGNKCYTKCLQEKDSWKEKISECYKNCFKENVDSQENWIVNSYYEAFSSIAIFLELGALYTAAQRAAAAYDGSVYDYECDTSSPDRVIAAWIFLFFILAIYGFYFLEFVKCSDESCKHVYGKILLLVIFLPALFCYLIADNEEIIHCTESDRRLSTSAVARIKFALFLVTFLLMLIPFILYCVFYIYKYFLSYIFSILKDCIDFIHECLICINSSPV